MVTTSTTTPQTVKVESDGKLTITHLSGIENWKTWKIRVQDWLHEKDLYNMISSNHPVVDPNVTPAVTQANINAWNTKAYKVLAAICRNVTDEVMPLIGEEDTPRAAWEILLQNYEKTGFTEAGHL